MKASSPRVRLAAHRVSLAAVSALALWGGSTAMAQTAPFPSPMPSYNGGMGTGSGSKDDNAALPIVGNKVKNPLPAMAPDARPLSIPLSNQDMHVDEKHVDGQLSEAEKQADSRLKRLELGSGNLPDADTTPYKSDLDEIDASQRQIQRLELKQREAELAAKLWQTVYDGKREHETDAAGKPIAAPAAPQVPMGLTNPMVPPLPVPPQAVPQVQATTPAAQETEKKAEDSHKADAHESASKVVPHEPPYLPPKVVSVTGMIGDMSADILIPCSGEQKVSVGSELPDGYTVTSITVSNVKIRNAKGKTISLGWGNTVSACQETEMSSNTEQDSRKAALGLPPAPQPPR